ncbi:MAG: hypothetical protein LBJ84_04660 [Oscillospiraceae bacterium]|nr:hypothetical protein [Oscillospiraceae bacterium]
MLKGTNFVDLLDSPFSRRGSFLALANDNQGENLYGKCTLWLCNCRIAGITDFNQNNGFRRYKLQLVKDGVPLPCVISTTPYEVILHTRHGSARFCIGERKLLMAQSEDGLSLRMTPATDPMAFFMNREPAPPPAPPVRAESAVLDFGASRLLATPIEGTLMHGEQYSEIVPGGDGTVVLAIEDFFEREPVGREKGQYPDYSACVQSVREDFDGYCEAIAPSLPGEFEPKRLQALWQTWSMTVIPDGEAAYKRVMVKMVHSIFEGAFVWQQPLQAIVHSRDLPLAWEIFCSGFEHMDPDGRMTDSLTFREEPSFGLKPPVHGVALLWLMDNCDFASIPLGSKKWVWDRLVKWTEFFTKLRDTDGDGLVEFAHILETGWEDAPYFNVGFPCACPDLNTLIALQMEAIARLGRDIGVSGEVCARWESASGELVRKIAEKFWDGSEWFAFNAETGERSRSHTASLYFTLLLGERLPREIIDKSIEYMFRPEGFETPYGLATETLDSDWFNHGFTQGSIITPSSFWLALALEACGRRDLACRVSRAYCAMLRDTGFFHIHNALTGREDRSLTAFGERGLFWSAWSSSTYIFLAEKFS